jgi:hypothetical protein
MADGVCLFRLWQQDGTWRRIVTRLQARADAAGLITWDVVGVPVNMPRQVRQYVPNLHVGCWVSSLTEFGSVTGTVAGDRAVGQLGWRMRRRRRPNFARPYICRFSILTRLTWPSTAPELQGRVSPAVTAARSRCRPFANECSGGSSPASTAAIHCGSRAPRPDWSSPEAARSAGDEFYVHSARSPANPWFGRALRNGTGRIRAGDLERDVIFAAADPDAHTDIDAAYHAKYDRYGAAIVESVVGEKARAVTIRLVPRA